MKKRLRIILGTAIIILGCSIPLIEKGLVSVIVTPEPSIRQVMEIERPSDEMITLVTPWRETITEKQDQESFAIFNEEFSDRISQYEAKGQSVLQIYSSVSKEVFGKKLKDNYGGEVGSLVVEAMESVLGEFDTPLTDEKKLALTERFSAIAWSLGGESDE